jgi:hypothetical protein
LGGKRRPKVMISNFFFVGDIVHVALGIRKYCLPRRVRLHMQPQSQSHSLNGTLPMRAAKILKIAASGVHWL